MTEVELQRLAELLSQVSSANSSLERFWGFLSGVAIAAFSVFLQTWVSGLGKRRAVAKVDREELLSILERYRETLRQVFFPKGRQDTNRLAVDVHNERLEIRNLLDRTNDRKYSPLIANILLNSNKEDLWKTLERTINLLRQDTRPFSESLEGNSGITVDSVKDGPFVAFAYLLSLYSTRFASAARRFEKILRRLIR